MVVPWRLYSPRSQPVQVVLDTAGLGTALRIDQKPIAGVLHLQFPQLVQLGEKALVLGVHVLNVDASGTMTDASLMDAAIINILPSAIHYPFERRRWTRRYRWILGSVAAQIDVSLKLPNIPTLDEGLLRRPKDELPIFRKAHPGSSGRELVAHKNLNGVLTFCRRIGESRASIQLQLDNLVKLQRAGSPNILRVEYLISRHSYFYPTDPEAPLKPQTRLCGYVQSFLGPFAQWWHPGEWDWPDKQVLIAGLIDAAADIESRGVFLTLLKWSNILLSPKDNTIKLLGLNPGHMSIFYSHPSLLEDDSVQPNPAFTVFALGRAILEIVTEERPPPRVPLHRNLPIPVRTMITACLTGQYASVNLLRRGLSEEIKQMRGGDRNQTGRGGLARLIQQRACRLSDATFDWNERFLTFRAACVPEGKAV